MEEWFEKAKLNLREGYKGKIYAFFILLILCYLIIWLLIEPLGMSNHFCNESGIFYSRLFYHLLLSCVTALVILIGSIRSVNRYLEKIGFGTNDTKIHDCWKTSEEKPVNLIPKKDGHFGDILEINSKNKYAIDYDIIPKAQNAIGVEYIVKPGKDFVFYIKVQVKSNINDKLDNIWIALVPNIVVPEPYGIGNKEWSYPIIPKYLPDSWLRYNVKIKKAVKETFGTKGWKYYKLMAIRIRGNTNLESIRIF